MSTSYKHNFQQVKSVGDTKRVSLFGQVIKVNSDSNNIELEGTINVRLSNHEILTNVFPRNYGNQQLPLKGELVEIIKDDFDGRYYYGYSANVHNYPTHNSPNESVITTEDFVEPTSINPYKIFTGDTILQGRFGQSIRLSQSIPDKTPWQGSIGNSIITISSGQVETEDGSFLITEDLNQDPSSLYLAENITLPLIDESKRASYEEAIVDGSSYGGNQAVLNSDRLYLNAREDSILLSAQSGSIGLSGNTINLDGITSIRLDAPSYNLQANTFTTTNESRTIDSQTSTYNYDQFNLNGTNITIDHSRIALGQNAVHPLIQSNELMADVALLTTNISSLSVALSGVVAVLAVLPGGQAPAAALQAAATSLQTQATSIQTKASSGTYLSTKAFTE